jgi:geranylgeranyl pyrophosphate synthase
VLPLLERLKTLQVTLVCPLGCPRRRCLPHRRLARQSTTHPPASPPPRPACSDITERHRRLAEISEMLHTASLVHDDVLDECDTRRGGRLFFCWF